MTYPHNYLGWSLDLGLHEAELQAAGWDTFAVRQRIGRGYGAFSRASARLQAWEMQRHAGLRPLIDANVVTLKLGPILQRCWIVASDSTAVKSYVAYGTMAGHVESGEESFTVWLEGDEVWAECAAFSRPNSWVIRLAGPVARGAQRLMARRYLDALVED